MSAAAVAQGMNVQQARCLTEGRLLFGDSDQILAVRTLAAFEELVEKIGQQAWSVCRHCNQLYTKMDLSELRRHNWVSDD